MDKFAYLKGYSAKGCVLFSQAACTSIQPGSPSRWADCYRRGKDTYLLLCPGYKIPIRKDAETTTFDGYLKPYVDDGIIPVTAIRKTQQLIADNQGGSVDLASKIKSLFEGTTALYRFVTEEECIGLILLTSKDRNAILTNP
jgi:hypothetical protein